MTVAVPPGTARGADLESSYQPLTDFGGADEPESPAWWVKTLGDELMTRRQRIEPLWARFKGDAPLPELGNPAASRGRERVWKAFQRKARMNLTELIVRAVAERLNPLGCRIETANDDDATPVPRPATGVADAIRRGTPERPQASADDQRRNATARRVWLANRMALAAGEIIEKFLAMGESYAIVAPPDRDVDPTVPVITAEDPRYVITYQDPARPLRIMAGLKLYHDPVLGRDVCWLYLPGKAIRMERTGVQSGATSIGLKRFRFNPADWVVVDVVDLEPYIGKRVPIARFENHDGEAEFETHTDHLDRINHMILQRIVIATLQAFRQRAIKGIPTTDKATGREIDYSDVFTNDPGALWLLPATAEMWESGQVDLSGILTSTRDDVRDLAAVLRLPVQHFMPDAVSGGSAEGATSGKEGLIFRAEDRQTRADVGFSDMMSLALGYLQGTGRAGGDGANAPDGTDNPTPPTGAAGAGPSSVVITTLWKPIERYSLEARHDAASKASGILPWESIMTDIYGYEPDDLPRLRAQRADDQLLAATAAVQTAAAPTSRADATSGTGEGRPTSAGQSGTDNGAGATAGASNGSRPTAGSGART